MRKFLSTILLFLLIASVTSAQDLLAKIPAKANAIATINTGKLFQLMTIEEWNNSNFGKKLLGMTSKGEENSLKSLSDIGLNLSGNIYYFHAENDSIHYNYVLGSLSDASKFAKLFSDKPSLQLDGNTSIIAEEDSTGFFIWNKQQFLYAKGIIKDGYFYDYEVAKRHGLTLPYVADTTTTVMADSAYAPLPEYPPTVDTVVTVIEEPAPEPVKPATPIPSKKSTTSKSKATKSKKAKKPVKKPVEEVVEEEIKEEAPADYDTYMKTDTAVTYDYGYNKDYQIKKSIASACTKEASIQLFMQNPDTSILSNADFMKTIDPNAAATIWLGKPMELYYNMLTGYYSYGSAMNNPFFNRLNNSMYKNFTSKLFFEEKQVRIATQSEMTNEMIDVQQKIFSRKLNKKLLKYINTDSLLGYMSVSMDTKSYLEGFPKILENTYGSMGMGLNGDDYGVISEFISFLIDEEAISNLVKGDGIVLFTGLYPQQTTYTDYVYDDNFNSTPVEKTKTDTLPRFLFMFSSEENSFERKLISYGIKKEVVKQADGFYEINIPKSPMNLFFTNRDGIFFLTNSVDDIRNISSGKFVAKISKQEKKLLQSHNYALYISPEKIVGKLANTEVGAAESLSSAMTAFRQMGTVRGLMHPLQGNVMSGELTMEVTGNKSNSLKYFFDIFDSLAK